MPSTPIPRLQSHHQLCPARACSIYIQVGPGVIVVCMRLIITEPSTSVFTCDRASVAILPRVPAKKLAVLIDSRITGIPYPLVIERLEECRVDTEITAISRREDNWCRLCILVSKMSAFWIVEQVIHIVQDMVRRHITPDQITHHHCR